MILIISDRKELVSELIQELNELNFTNLILASADDADTAFKNLKYDSSIRKVDLISWIEGNSEEIEFIFELSDDTSQGKILWKLGFQNQIPIIYYNTDNEFSEWVEKQDIRPFYWEVLKDNPKAETMIRWMLKRNF